MMVTPEKELIARFDVFADTEILADSLYALSHDDEIAIAEGGKYTLMEARDNLLGLYDLCRSFVVAQMGREHKAKYGYDPMNGKVPNVQVQATGAVLCDRSPATQG
jgi:hypothetical protein